MVGRSLYDFFLCSTHISVTAKNNLGSIPNVQQDAQHKIKTTEAMNKENYPLGAANDSRAPWNETKKEDVNVDIEYSCTLCKITNVSTNDYEEGETYIDEDGFYCRVGDDFTYTDFVKEYQSQHYTPEKLIEILSEIAEDFANGRTPDKNISEWKHIIEECKGWFTDDEDAIRE